MKKDAEEALDLAASEMGITVNNPVLLRGLLEKRVNELLLHDFDRLISILYRMDVAENKLMRLLQEHPGQDAAVIITDLVIERQLQKINSRRNFSGRSSPSDDGEEKW